MSDIKAPKITYRVRADGGGYIVFADGDRIGFVIKEGGRWHATDAFLVAARSHATRAKAAAFLLKRYKNVMGA